jgi:predicted neuraminidase
MQSQDNNNTKVHMDKLAAHVHLRGQHLQALRKLTLWQSQAAAAAVIHGQAVAATVAAWYGLTRFLFLLAVIIQFK